MRLLYASTVLVALGSMSYAQTGASPKTQDHHDCRLQQDGSTRDSGGAICVLSTVPPPASQRFPYPGDSTSAPVEIPPAPAAQAPIAGPAAKQFPYPGETVPAPVAPLDQGENRRNDSSSSSSRSPETDSPADNRVPEVPPVRRRLPKPERVQSDEDREAEDLSVAKFYRQSGNPNAAYLRTKDAVKLQADDPEAHFALAQLALQLGKREEAAAEYASYLKLDPDGDNSRAAQKALTLLGYQK